MSSMLVSKVRTDFQIYCWWSIMKCNDHDNDDDHGDDDEDGEEEEDKANTDDQ